MSQPPTKAKRFWSGAEHYAADMVMEEVRGLIGDVKQDIVVDTTIDPNLERDAEKALTHVLQGDGKKQGASQAALVSIDGTGAIRAVVGGADYAESQFNRAAKAKRQPGSIRYCLMNSPNSFFCLSSRAWAGREAKAMEKAVTLARRVERRRCAISVLILCGQCLMNVMMQLPYFKPNAIRQK